MIGLELARTRLLNGYSLDNLSKMVEISPETIEKIEIGDIDGLYMEIVSLALVLNVDLPTLFGGEMKPAEQDAQRTFTIAKQMSRMLAG